MRVLVADDDAIHRHIVAAVLTEAGYSVTVVNNGVQALEALREPGAPRLAVLDWIMPGLEGPEVCRQLRAEETSTDPRYLLLLTGLDKKHDIVRGFQAGANDYVTKPFDDAELLARVRAGARIMELQQMLADRVQELERALAQVHQLEGLLPICSYCRKIRNEGQYWENVETYISERSGARFTHGICPSCYDRVVADLKAQNGG